jgi:hypothetical protein
MSRKIYCYGCETLVRCREEKEENILYSVCCRCDKKLYKNEGVIWEHLKDRKEESFVEPILSPMKIDGRWIGKKSKKKNMDGGGENKCQQ